MIEDIDLREINKKITNIHPLVIPQAFECLPLAQDTFILEKKPISETENVQMGIYYHTPVKPCKDK